MIVLDVVLSPQYLCEVKRKIQPFSIASTLSDTCQTTPGINRFHVFSPEMTKNPTLTPWGLFPSKWIPAFPLRKAVV